MSLTISTFYHSPPPAGGGELFNFVLCVLFFIKRTGNRLKRIMSCHETPLQRRRTFLPPPWLLLFIKLQIQNFALGTFDHNIYPNKPQRLEMI